jgi:hypothetical protein
MPDIAGGLVDLLLESGKSSGTICMHQEPDSKLRPFSIAAKPLKGVDNKLFRQVNQDRIWGLLCAEDAQPDTTGIEFQNGYKTVS